MAQAGEAAGGARSRSWMDIYGFAMLDIGAELHADPPRLVRHAARDASCPSFDGEFGKDGSTFAGVRQTRFGVKTGDADRARRAEDAVRVRAVRHGRRLRPDHVPPAPRLRRSWERSARARPGARSWTPTCSRTRSSTGDRPGMVFFRNVQLRYMPIEGDTQLTLALERPGRQRRPGACTRTASSCRTSRRGSRCRTSPAQYRMTRHVGLRPGGRHPAPDQLGRHARRPVRPERQRHGLGHQPQLEPEVRQAATCCGCSWSTAKASRTT